MKGTYHGRRLRCDGCRARVPPAKAYEHYLECRSTLAFPYRPDRVREGEQAELEAFA